MGRLRVARGLLSWVLCYGAAFAQTATSSGAPPKVLLLVSQQMLPGKAGERDKFELETCRKFDEFGIPIPWIEMEAVTGEPGALFFDPANSFEEMERAGQLLSEAYSAHPELAQLQDEIEARLASSKNILAVLRDDLGGGRDRIDLSKAHYLRITTVSVCVLGTRAISRKRRSFAAAVKRIRPGPFIRSIRGRLHQLFLRSRRSGHWSIWTGS